MRRCERSDLYASIQTAFDLFFVRVFQQKIDRFFDHLLRFFNRPSLAGHAEFRARRHKPIVLTLDHSRKFWQLHQGKITA
jgi:hypothetical protein